MAQPRIPPARSWNPILARAASVDLVIALYPSDGDRGLTGAWGYTWGRVGWLGGAGFSSIVSDPWAGWAGMEDAEHGFVHEWLHQVEAVYRELGLRLTSSRRSTTSPIGARPGPTPPTGTRRTSSTSAGPGRGGRGIATT